MHHNILEIFLFLTIIILAAKSGGWLSTRLGQPAVLGEILVGLLLGPSLIGISGLPIFPESHGQLQLFGRQEKVIEEVVQGHEAAGEEVSPEEVVGNIATQARDAIVATDELGYASGSGREIIADAMVVPLEEVTQERTSFLEDVIKVLAQVGVLFLMFMAGIETDLALMKRVGKVAFSAALGGVIVPFLLGFFVTLYMIPGHGIYTAIFTGTILCATSVSISAQTLKELHALTSKEGTCILGAAVIDDVMGIIVLSLVIAFNPMKAAGQQSHAKMYEILQNWISNGMGLQGDAAGITGIVLLIVCMSLFFLIFYFFGAVFFERILTWAGKLPVSEPKIAFAIGIGLLFAWAAEYIGAVAAITGTYFAGVLMGQTSHKHEIEEKLGIITYAFFVPIFFVNIGLEANVQSLGGKMAWFAAAICVVAIIGKIIGSLIGAKVTGFNFIESLRVGTGMVSRGEVGLIVASVGLSAGIIMKEIFSAMILMVLVTTLVTPIGLRFVFPRGGPHESESAPPI
jgi:Kef-type K+ transport system membrane component KefB